MTEAVRRLLLHVCCAPCAAYSVPALRELVPEVEGWFANPNIQPREERARRLEALERFAPAIGLPLAVAPDDALERFLAAVPGPGRERCRACYGLRLRSAAREARRRGCDAFSTTLLYSIHMQHDLVRAVGEEVAREEGVPFLYRDLRAGWEEGWRRYRPTGLHRQWYCGCAWSRAEREEQRRAHAARSRGA